MRGQDGTGPQDKGERTRLYVPQSLVVDGGLVELGSEQTHYLRHVLRLGPGGSLALFNSRDGEWRAVIVGGTRDRCRVRLEGLRRPPEAPTSDLWLLFAPIKRACIDILVEKATELGVSRLLPVLTRHTDVARVNLDRLAAIAIEAAEQCERLDVPNVADPQPLSRVLANWPSGRVLLACVERGAARPLAAAAMAHASGPAAILVGPEGGWATCELDELARYPFVVPVGLGPRILRAETAALAAVACWQAWCGDGLADGGTSDHRPPFRALSSGPL